MLALTRKKDEAIIIEGNIRIQILDIVDGKVKIGIDAPANIGIYREEVYLDIQASNQAAAAVADKTVQELTALIKKQK